MNRTVILIAAALISACGLGFAQQRNDYERGTYVTAAADTLPFRYLEPIKVEGGEKYPLVLFLHGAGERGSDNEAQLLHCSRFFTNPVNRLDFPAYVVFPQCPESGYWAYEERPETFSPEGMPVGLEETRWMRAVVELVELFASRYPVDRDRIYVMGLSMGAMATYDLILRHPSLFAAAVPICGTVAVSRLSDAPKIPIHIFHGDADASVPVEASREAFLRLREVGVPVEYTEYPGVGHGSWNAAISSPGLLEWLFAQHR